LIGENGVLHWQIVSRLSLAKFQEASQRFLTRVNSAQLPFFAFRASTVQLSIFAAASNPIE